MRFIRGFACVFIGGLLSSAVFAAGTDYAAVRAQRAANLTQPYGWFSLVALEWLKDGATTVGSAQDNNVVLADGPAHLLTVEQKGGKVQLLRWDASVSLGGKPLKAGEQPVVSADESEDAALVSGSIRIWAIERGGQRYLRVKDADAPGRVHFHGLRWYAPVGRYRVEAKWVPYATPHAMQVVNKLGQVEKVPVPGRVEFAIDGKQETLTPLEASKDQLWFVFRDATSHTTTDGGGRFLTTAGPSNGLDKPGTVVLDFNEAVNPPCAYSPYATCPLASRENRLEVAIPAGEKRYED